MGVINDDGKVEQSGVRRVSRILGVVILSIIVVLAFRGGRGPQWLLGLLVLLAAVQFGLALYLHRGES